MDSSFKTIFAQVVPATGRLCLVWLASCSQDAMAPRFVLASHSKVDRRKASESGTHSNILWFLRVVDWLLTELHSSLGMVIKYDLKNLLLNYDG